MSAHKYTLAMNTSVDNETLMELATDSDDAVRLAVARNPSSKAAVLQLLALDKSKDVRNSVLTHHAAPEALVGEHPSVDVRKAVAANLACPLDLLLQLSHDSKSEVVGISASNTSMPSYRLDEMAREPGRKIDAKKIYIANNRSAEASTLTWLLELNENDVSMISELIKNPSLPFIDKLRVALLGLNDSISGQLRTLIRAKPGEFWKVFADEGNLRLQDEIAYSGRKVVFGEALIEAGMIEEYQALLSIELEQGISAAGMGGKQISDHQSSVVMKKMM